MSSSPARLSRGARAIVGAAVADAASLGTHWLYDRAAVDAAAGGSLGRGGEFSSPVARWHAARRAGQLTMYGEGLLVMSRSLAAKGGRLDVADFNERWMASFGPCGSFSGYADGVTKATVLSALTIAAECSKLTYPPAAVLDGAARGRLWAGAKAAAEALAAGAELDARAAAVATDAGLPEHADWAVAAARAWDRMMRSSIATTSDKQSNTMGKLVPAAVAYAGKADFDEAVERAIRATQDHDEVVAYFAPLARIIEAAVTGAAASPLAAVEAGLAHVKDAAHAARLREAVALAAASEEEKPTWDVVQKFGSACDAASTAPVAVFMLLRHGGSFVSAVRFNMVGESAARACFIGAVLAALGGADGAGALPAEWLERLEPAARAEVLELAQKIAP